MLQSSVLCVFIPAMRVVISDAFQQLFVRPGAVPPPKQVFIHRQSCQPFYSFPPNLSRLTTMKITLTLLALLPSIHAACYTPPPIDTSIVQKRTPQIDEFDFLSGPSAITIDLPAQFLPPPWSPSSGLDSPYPSTGVSPWDDSGRAQMLDNMPLWRTCPRLHLDCRKCPRDFRCRRASGAQPENDGQEKCPLRKCDDELVFTRCGDRARCTRGYCVCELGMKAQVGWRGQQGLEGLTVYADVGADCEVKCEDLSCKEVGQLEEGVCWKSGGEVGNDNDRYGTDGLEGVTYDNVGSFGQAG
ncbi:hypothetical protein BDU57DRAFT_595776 [Ampelomyces quisqualis]|uniref:Uncharacterized protein n=1 Tax=Ampelomyces quisqualis TaxID=50730 RepID=A0A6A5QMA1_AMPQU|nr:hypothetical protein BDU57DRAFT_595776 [Ampelomyces quisqualis]